MSTTYNTRKSGREGKRLTIERRTIRAVKYAGGAW